MSTLVFPYIFGHPAWGDREFTGPLGLPLFNEIAGVYVGILPLLLAGLTAATEFRRDRDVRFFAVFAALDDSAAHKTRSGFLQQRGNCAKPLRLPRCDHEKCAEGCQGREQRFVFPRPRT